jgi:hypothetical protein
MSIANTDGVSIDYGGNYGDDYGGTTVPYGGSEHMYEAEPSVKSERMSEPSVKSEAMSEPSVKSERMSDLVKAESVKSEPSVKAESVKAESVKSESVKSESVKSEGRSSVHDNVVGSTSVHRPLGASSHSTANPSSSVQVGESLSLDARLLRDREQAVRDGRYLDLAESSAPPPPRPRAPPVNPADQVYGDDASEHSNSSHNNGQVHSSPQASVPTHIAALINQLINQMQNDSLQGRRNAARQRLRNIRDSYNLDMDDLNL